MITLLSFHLKIYIIVATEVVGGWEKEGEKTTVGRGPRAGSGRPGRFKIQVVSWAGAKNSHFDFSGNLKFKECCQFRCCKDR
jgi:hypothetical protein